ncbi:unnamed protein product [Rangifer tarandus platyrhynchus]|uniref:Uncharacterized protein n=1 Tax=Rangifer tarandus platyrhynchus TaxID=3082113 RepID=A0AC59YFD4_RANTA
MTLDSLRMDVREAHFEGLGRADGGEKAGLLPLTYCLNNFGPEVAKLSIPNLILTLDPGAEMPGSVQGCGHLCLGLTSTPPPCPRLTPLAAEGPQ